MIPNSAFVRLMLFAFFGTIVACAIGLLACLTTNSVTLAVLAPVSALAAGGFFLMRWWLGVCRKAGLSTKVFPTPEAAPYGLACVAGLVGIVALEYITFAMTRNRWLEASLAIVLGVPTMLLLVRKSLELIPRPKPQEASLYRFNFYVMAVLPFISLLNVSLQLTEHPDPGLAVARELNIAGAFLLIVAMPFFAYLSRYRFLQAREAAKTSELATT